MPDPAGLSAELIARQAMETDGCSLAESRAAELAAEVDRLNRLVLRAAERWLDRPDDPTRFLANTLNIYVLKGDGAAGMDLSFDSLMGARTRRAGCRVRIGGARSAPERFAEAGVDGLQDAARRGCPSGRIGSLAFPAPRGVAARARHLRQHAALRDPGRLLPDDPYRRGGPEDSLEEDRHNVVVGRDFDAGRMPHVAQKSDQPEQQGVQWK